MFDETGPARSGAWSYNRRAQPFGFVAFPAFEHLREQFFAVLKMPVEAAFADAEVARQQFDAHRLDPFGGQPREGGADPVVRLQW